MKKSSQIFWSFLIGGFASALFPSAFFIFIVFTQDYSPYEKDIYYIKISTLIFFLIGGVIGGCVAYFQASLFKSLFIGSLTGLVSYILGSFNSPVFTGNNNINLLYVLISLLVYLIFGCVVGFICWAFVSRT